MSPSAGPVRIERVRVADLTDLARRAVASREPKPLLPITPQRAEAQACNPAASPDDTALLIATLDGRTIGYLGMFPVWLETSGVRRKVFTLTTYFVMPEHRSSGAGTLLMLDAVALGVDLFVGGFADITARVCRAVGFRDVGPVTVLTLRIDTAIVVPRVLARTRDLAGSGLAARAVDAAARISRATIEPLLRAPLTAALRRAAGATGAVAWFAAAGIVKTPAGARHLRDSGEGARFVRDDATVDWMIGNPWLVEGSAAPLDYAFSHQRSVFRFLPFVLRETGGGRELGYAVLRVSGDGQRTEIAILDAVLAAPELRSAVIDLALREARRWAAGRVLCGDEYAPIFEASPLLRALTRREQRGALYLSRNRDIAVGDAGSRIMVGVCDGDAPYV